MKKTIKNIVQNRKAYHDYHILEKLEAGIVLQGTEVKSIRQGKISLKDSFVRIINDEAFLLNCHISPYQQSGVYDNHDPERERKLLLQKREIRKLRRKVEEKGVTIIPLRVYLKGSKVKVEIALAKGKKQYDKKEAITKRDAERDIKRQLKFY